MASKHQNRKRIRHRSNSSRRALMMRQRQMQVSAAPPAAAAATQHVPVSNPATPLPPLAASNYNYSALPKHMLAPATTVESISPKPPRLFRQESARSRDKRMFGGEDDDTESAMELRGPMLDVVLGLFNGIDYDDTLLC